MPTTSQNVSWIRYRLPKYTRQEILTVLDEVQLIVYSEDVTQTEYIDPATGLPPFIATTAGKFDYACPANCRRVIAVFSDSPITTYSRTRPTPQTRRYYYRNLGYFEMAVNQRDALPGGVAARVIFQEDPGTTTTDYYLQYYVQPTPLTSEAIQMTLPEHTHWRVRQGVLSMLSSEEYGQTGFDDAVMEKVTRVIRNQLNRGAQSRTGRTPWRAEWQEYAESSHGYYI